MVKNIKDIRATVSWQQFKDAKRVDLMDELIGGLLKSQPKERESLPETLPLARKKRGRPVKKYVH